MVSILRVRDDKGNIIEIPAIRGEKGNTGEKGDKGDPGDSGIYTLAEGETIADAPDDAKVVVDPYTDPPAVEIVATFADGTTATYNFYGEAVTA